MYGILIGIGIFVGQSSYRPTAPVVIPNAWVDEDNYYIVDEDNAYIIDEN